jgi:hypothetical protein
MSWQGSLTRASGALLGGLISWQGFAELKRAAHEKSVKKRVLADSQGRKIGETFSAGSTEDTINETLQTGDLVFFNRPCVGMRPCGSALCAATKYVSNSSFDHVGMIYVRRDFKPMLVEKTFSGIKVRPWDERLSRSRAGEVIIHPLRCRRTPEIIERVTRTIEETTSDDCGSDGVVNALASLSLLAKRWSSSSNTNDKRRQLKARHAAAAENYDGTEQQHSPKKVQSSVSNGSAALVNRLLQEMGALAKEGDPGQLSSIDICPEDLLHANMKHGAKLREPIYVRTYV